MKMICDNAGQKLHAACTWLGLRWVMTPSLSYFYKHYSLVEAHQLQYIYTVCFSRHGHFIEITA